jgi:hypothetical protein
MKKPRVFIGSSSEGLFLARAIEESLAQETEPVLWKNDVFLPSLTTIESLEKAIDTVEFAILVVTPDDVRTKRETAARVPRDNVVFELGLFMGRLGRDRAFIVTDEHGCELPTDLLGVTVVTYDAERSQRDPLGAVSPASSQILRTIRRVPRRHTVPKEACYQSALFDEDQFLHAVVSWPPLSKAVTVLFPHTKWVWQLFPALLCWRISRTPILVQTTAPVGDATSVRQEVARRELLVNLGIRVEEVPILKRSGFFRWVEYPADSGVIVFNANPQQFVPYATQYDGMTHSQAVTALMEGIPSVKSGDFVPEIINCDIGHVIASLRRGVDQYSRAGVSAEFGQVRTSELYLMSPYARAYKYKQLKLLFGEYERAGIEPFGSAAVKLASGAISIITPPVVELHDVGPVVVEGTTRAVFCRDSRATDFPCIKVGGVREPLPGTPIPIDQVSLTERSLSPSERMEGFNYVLFRHIERAIHPY